MIDKAINKLKTEMDKNKDNPYIQVVGEFLIQHLNENPGAAEKLLREGKNIGKSLKEMENIARKKQAKGSCMFTPQEGFEIVLKYFEIEGTIDKADIFPVVKPVHAPTENVQVKPKKDIDFDVNLEDFL